MVEEEEHMGCNRRFVLLNLYTDEELAVAHPAIQDLMLHFAVARVVDYW
jgi:hypothetical protein